MDKNQKLNLASALFLIWGLAIVSVYLYQLRGFFTLVPKLLGLT